MKSSELFSFHFLGGVGTITGSKTLIKVNGLRVLVDCGLFQGLKPLRLKNWEDFPIDPTSIDVVILTHSHLDHSGYLPLLMKKGFKGEIHCTEATEELTNIILTDSAKIQEEDGEPHQSDALRVKIEDECGWHCEVPQMNDKFTIDQ